MDTSLEAARSNRTVVISVVAAAIAITLFCLVGIALMLGWISLPRTDGITPASMASPAQQVTGTLPALETNESAVPSAPPPPAQGAAEPNRTPGRPGPAAPNYDRRAPPADPVTPPPR